MGDREVPLLRGQCAGEGGVGVSVEDDAVEGFVADGLEYLFGERSRSRRRAIQQPGRTRNGEVVEEYLAHVMVVVLAGVEDLLLHRGPVSLVVQADGSAHHGRLDELWAGAYDRQYLYTKQSSKN